MTKKAITDDLKSGGQPKYPIGSVDNALRLLLLLKESSPISVVEASRKLDVAPSTAHRLLVMLQYNGFVRQEPRTPWGAESRPAPEVARLHAVW